jgi:hypothetical protein
VCCFVEMNDSQTSLKIAMKKIPFMTCFLFVFTSCGQPDWRELAEEGDVEAKYELARALNGQGEREEAYEWFRKAAEAGHRRAARSSGENTWTTTTARRQLDGSRWPKMNFTWICWLIYYALKNLIIGLNCRKGEMIGLISFGRLKFQTIPIGQNGFSYGFTGTMKMTSRFMKTL